MFSCCFRCWFSIHLNKFGVLLVKPEPLLRHVTTRYFFTIFLLVINLSHWLFLMALFWLLMLQPWILGQILTRAWKNYEMYGSPRISSKQISHYFLDSLVKRNVLVFLWIFWFWFLSTSLSLDDRFPIVFLFILFLISFKFRDTINLLKCCSHLWKFLSLYLYSHKSQFIPWAVLLLPSSSACIWTVALFTAFHFILSLLGELKRCHIIHYSS